MQNDVVPDSRFKKWMLFRAAENNQTLLGNKQHGKVEDRTQIRRTEVEAYSRFLVPLLCLLLPFCSSDQSFSFSICP